jgi:hypothetical protein
MRIEIAPAEIRPPLGLEIGVKGFQSSPADYQHFPAQVYIEIYEGKLRVCVWNGSSEDPAAIHVIEPLGCKT